MRKHTPLLFALWCAAIFCSLLFALPFVHGVIADVLARRTDVPYDRWLRRCATFRFRPLFLSVSVPLVLLHFFRPSTGSLVPRSGSYPRAVVVSVIAATAVLSMLLLSMSSPLYAHNLWNDANIIYTVGKGMAHGLLPYRDLYERKGILVYALHALGYVISPDSFTGVYLLECVAAFFFLLLAYKTVRLYTPRSSLFLVPLFAAVVYAAWNTKSGDSAEEYCLPLLLYPLYLSLRSLKGGSGFRGRDLFFCGVCAGCVLWIKFNLVGFFIGWAVFPVAGYARRGLWRRLAAHSLMFALGALAATVPWVCYFGAHGAISDWLGMYLFSNMYKTTRFLDGNTQPLAKKAARLCFFYVRYVPKMVHYDIHLFFLALTSALFLWRRERREVSLHVACAAAATYFFAYFGGAWERYYSVVFDVFYVFALVPLHEALLPLWRASGARSREARAIAAVAVSVAFVVYAVSCYRFIGFMAFKRELLPQHEFAEIMDSYPGSTVLTYKFMDRGFYTIAHRLPPYRFFFLMGPNSESEEHVRLTEEWVLGGNADFLVTEDERPDIPGYTVVASSPLRVDYGNYFEDSVYYLYRRDGL